MSRKPQFGALHSKVDCSESTNVGAINDWEQQYRYQSNKNGRRRKESLSVDNPIVEKIIATKYEAHSFLVGEVGV